MVRLKVLAAISFDVKHRNALMRLMSLPGIAKEEAFQETLHTELENQHTGS